MIGKVVHGTSFYKTISYVAGKEGAYLIGSNLASNDPIKMAEEMRQSAHLRRSLKTSVWHITLSTPHTESLSDELWNQIAHDYLKAMGFTRHQYAVYRHTDCDHHHIHIVASRLSIADASLVSDSWSKRRSESEIRAIEKRYGLTQVAPSASINTRAPTTGEVRMSRRTGKKPPRVIIQEQVRRALAVSSSPLELQTTLSEVGIETRFRHKKDSTISGISFGYQGVAFKGSQLGRDLSWTRMAEHLQATEREHLGDLKVRLKRRYNEVASTLPQALKASDRDALIAATLIRDGCTQAEVYAILSQSPVAQTIKIDRREKAIAYIEKVTDRAQLAVARQKELETER